MENSKAVIFCRVITAGQADEKDKVDGKRPWTLSLKNGPPIRRLFTACASLKNWLSQR